MPRTAFKKGWVGITRSTHGISVTLVSGYHDRTTRANMAKEKKLRKGSKKAAVGCTHASVSANERELQDDNVGSNAVCISTAAGNMLCAVVVVRTMVAVAWVGNDAKGQKPLATPKTSETRKETLTNPIILIQMRENRIKAGSARRKGTRCGNIWVVCQSVAVGVKLSP